jgi:hypothetical protein
VFAAFPGVPLNDQAGWGYMLLSNMLPNGGNGAYTISVVATDVDGHSVQIAVRHITGNNSGSLLPFGTIDTPTQGQTVSATIVNFGWALAQAGRDVPADSSTISVLIDGAVVGHPGQRSSRTDITAAFPTFATDHAVGGFVLDTTTLTNGVHMIAWVVTDRSRSTQGVGSRIFSVGNPLPPGHRDRVQPRSHQAVTERARPSTREKKNRSRTPWSIRWFRHLGLRDAVDRQSRAVVIIFAIGTAALFCWYAASYAFLLDDSIIIRNVIARSIPAIFEHPLFSFYRPVEHVWVKTLFAVFGWSAPSGYIAASMILHIGCACGVTALAYRLRLNDAALFSGIIFLISPWATEPFLWMSGGFDLLTTTGVLACLIGGLVFLGETSTPDRRMMATVGFVIGSAGMVTAVCAKETGVVTPLLFVIVVTCIRGSYVWRERPALAYTLVLVLLVAAYLVARESLLPGLASAYGDARTLLRHTTVLDHIGSFGRALMWLPLLYAEQP